MCALKLQAKERSTASSLADTGGSIGGLLALGGPSQHRVPYMAADHCFSTRGGPILASWLGWQLTFALCLASTMLDLASAHLPSAESVSR